MANAQGTGEIIDRVIAVVGDGVILESEVYQNAQNLALQQGMNLLNDQEKFEQLKGEVLKEMINQKVLLAKAREDTLTVEPRDVDRELENRLQMIIQNVGSEEKVEELYGYPINRIRRDFRSAVEEGLMVEKVKQEHLRDLSITRTEIEQYFKDHPEVFPAMKDAVEIYHIMREVGSEAGDARARARADSLYEAIKAGASFDSLAVRLSDDLATAKNGGRIGWTTKGDLLSSYEDAAAALRVGEISRPVRSRYGYHIIRLEDKKENSEILTSHILIQTRTEAEDEQPTLDSLNIIRNEIVAGMPFETAAKNYSHDLESASRGGYLGWFALEEMPADFRAAIDTLKIGDVSQPFKTQYGYHLARLANRREAREVNLTQDWELIAQRALNAKREKEYLSWLDQLKSRYYIEIKE